MVLGHSTHDHAAARNGASIDSTVAPAPSVNAAQQGGTTEKMAPTRGQGGLGGNQKFHFATWIRLWGFDLITMAAMGAVGLGIYEANPAPSRSFPVYFTNGEVVYPQFAYPLRKEIVPIWLAALLAFIIPFVFFAVFQIRRRSFHDLTATTMGLLSALITAAVFQVWLKWLIGGLRPHFLAVCAPDVTALTAASGTGFGGIMFDRSVCTGDENQINDSLESFPSGHSTAAGAGFVYLALYFNAMLKVFSDHNPAYWKHVIFFAPLLGAVLIAGSLTIDEFHNWYDCAAGLIIGTTCAFASFRMVFASIWDFRFNHVLLPRTELAFLRHPSATLKQRFDYSLSAMSPSALPTTANERSAKSGILGLGAKGMHGIDGPFTRANGWGPGMNLEGAPGDALTGGGNGGGLEQQRGAGYV